MPVTNAVIRLFRPSFERRGAGQLPAYTKTDDGQSWASDQQPASYASVFEGAAVVWLRRGDPKFKFFAIAAIPLAVQESGIIEIGAKTDT